MNQENRDRTKKQSPRHPTNTGQKRNPPQQTATQKEKPRKPLTAEAVEPDRPIRLQKYLSECGIASRRGAEELIAAGQIKVNGETVTVPGTKVRKGIDHVTWKEKEVAPEVPGVIILHKPDGIISSTSDPQGRKTVMDLLPAEYQTYSPVGRLDYETTGLMILTNDGMVADRLLHPRYEVPRVYQALVFRRPSKETLKLLSTGIELDDGMVSAEVKVLGREERGFWLEVVLSVGKNRIVRRMLKAVGHTVHRLKRVAHGPVELGDLEMGKIRALSKTEYLQLKRHLGLPDL